MRSLGAALVVVALVLLPGAASAQEAGLRDPFDPLLTTETDSGTTPTDTGDGDTTGTTDTTTDDDGDTNTATDGLPDTGTDPRSWLALAYVLLAAGAGVLAYVRFSRGRPTPAERARGLS